ncbi:MAG: DAK2 domain-containing protein [Micromonosporaceae bacterium]|nr:DAK2 domain-containing protein [Micromonosporaceae bacterium]
MLERLDASVVRRWCQAGLDALRRHQREIDEMNVYPVPDGDTGTNLVMTVTAANRALAAEPDTDEIEGEITRLGRVLRCMARGALLGARGNSGVILSQLLRGIADALAAAPEARGRLFAGALADAADAGYAAVANPVEGTVLTVARAAAKAAAEADSDELPTVVGAAADGAAEALARTPEQLPVLAQAGVVDAGGYGLVVFLRALVEVVGAPSGAAIPGTLPLAAMARDPRLLTVEREAGSSEYQYEVQYLLDARAEVVEELKATLKRLGDSLVVVGTGETGESEQTFNVHVHVNDAGAAIEAGIVTGRPHRISVSRFADQETARVVGEAPPPEPDSRGFVVVCGGAGLAELFGEEGAAVVDGGPTHNPSISELLAAVRRTKAANVVVLPNDSNVRAVADAAAAEAPDEGLTVRVVHTRSPVQAVAALAVRDERRRFEDDVIAMAEAAGACRHAELTVATKAALTIAGQCEPGDVLGLLEGDVALIGADLTDCARQLLDRMLAAGGELATLVVGADAPDGLAEALQAHLRERWQFVEAQVYEGGQPHYPLLIGVE